MLSDGRWAATKESWLLSPGFELSDGTPVNIGSRFVLRSYTGRDGPDFSTEINIRWILTAAQVARSVSIDSTEIPALRSTIAYPDLGTTPVDIDRVVAEVARALLDRIAKLLAA